MSADDVFEGDHEPPNRSPHAHFSLHFSGAVGIDLGTTYSYGAAVPYDTIPNETSAAASVSGKTIGLKSLQTIVRIPGITRTISLDTNTTSEGNRTTPSYVAFSSDERLIGDAAKNQAAMNPKNSASASCPTRLLFFPYLIASLAVFDAKRLIGRRFECVLPTFSTPSPD